MAPGIHSPNLEFIYTTLPGPSHSMVSWAQLPTSQKSQCLVLLHALAMVLLTNPTDFHSSTFCLWHPNHLTPDCHYLQEFRLRTGSTLPRFQKNKTTSLGTPLQGGRRDVPQRQEREIMEQNIWAVGSGHKCFWRGEIVSGWIPVYSLNKLIESFVSQKCVLYTNMKGWRRQRMSLFLETSILVRETNTQINKTQIQT